MSTNVQYVILNSFFLFIRIIVLVIIAIKHVRNTITGCN